MLLGVVGETIEATLIPWVWPGTGEGVLSTGEKFEAVGLKPVRTKEAPDVSK